MQPQASYRIDTFVGRVAIGDEGPAVEAQLNRPDRVAVDRAGNLYIADQSNHSIRKVDATGTITTIAGTGERGFSGDEGPASEAQLSSPFGVAVDGAGNLYIADSSNNRIRKVDATGTITTIAGTGEFGFSGDGGPASEAQLYSPRGVAVDGAGNLYIADTRNNRIRKVDATGTITTITGTGERGFSGDEGSAAEAQLYSPYGVAVDGAGNLYIADTFDQRIRKVDATGTITTIAGTGEFGFSGDGGPATEAQLGQLPDVAVDGAGNLYIADQSYGRIRKVDSAGIITTIAGTGYHGFSGDGGPAAEAQLASPRGVAVDGAGNLYIADTSNHRVRKVDATGTITTIAGTRFSGDGGPASQAQLRNPAAVAVDGAGNLYIADTNSHSVRKVDATGTITTVAGTGESGHSGDGGPAAEAQLNSPWGVAVDGAGNLYIAEASTSRIRKVDATGTITTIAGIRGHRGFSGDGGPAAEAQLASPRGVAVDGAGNLYIADTSNHSIRKVDATGTITTIAGTGERGFSGDEGSAAEAQLNNPWNVAVDGAGNLYIADTSNHRIRKVDATGTITTIAGTGERGFSGDGGPGAEAQLNSPYGVAVDGAGNLYIADRNNHSIREVDATGTITTIAGTGEFGFSGDGGPAAEAQLDAPRGVAVDGAGNLYIADTTNHRVRLLTPTATELSLDFAHFANGEDIISDLVFVNVATHPIRPILYFYDKDGDPIDPESVVDLTGDLEVTGDGALSVRTEIEPLGELTLSTHGRENLVTGSVTVDANGPIGGVLRFDLPSIGVAGVGASLPLRDAIFPARRRAGGISTAAAIHNPGEEAMGVNCQLMKAGSVLEEMEIPLAANGQEAQFIEQMFTGTDTAEFVGSVRCTAPGLFTGVAVELDASNRIFTTLPVMPVNQGRGGETTLDFAHFANGEDIISEMVLVNLETEPRGPALSPFHTPISPIRPALYFYDKGGNPIDPALLVDLTGDLEITEDRALSIQSEMGPLEELTISTHGRGELVSGSVRVVSDGPIGGVLRFDLPGIGVAGVGASQPVRDAIFPARRQADGISTAAAIHNLGEEAMVVSCQLMKDGAVLEEAEIPLAASGQEARYIEGMFTATDTSDFVGSVRCTAPGEGLFTGVAVELDASNQIFTTLPVVPVEERMSQE